MRILQIALLVLQILLIANYQAPYHTDKQDFAKILMANNGILEASIDKKVGAIKDEVRRHFPQYRPLVPVVKEVHDVTESLCSVLDFFNRSENTETGNQVLYEYVVDSRATLIKILEQAESRETGIGKRDINNLIKNLNLKTKVKRLENQAKRKRLFQPEQPNPQLVELLRQKNDALIIANKVIDFLSRRIGSTSIACGFYPSTIVSTPEKGFVKTGETFETKIFLAAHYTQ